MEFKNPLAIGDIFEGTLELSSLGLYNKTGYIKKNYLDVRCWYWAVSLNHFLRHKTNTTIPNFRRLRINKNIQEKTMSSKQCSENKNKVFSYIKDVLYTTFLLRENIRYTQPYNKVESNLCIWGALLIMKISWISTYEHDRWWAWKPPMKECY